MPGMFGGMGSPSSIWKSCFATCWRGCAVARSREKEEERPDPLKVSALETLKVNFESVKVVKLYIHYLKKRRISP